MLTVGLTLAVFVARLLLELARPWLNDNFLLTDRTSRGSWVWRALWWVAMTGACTALVVVLVDRHRSASDDGTKAPGTVPAAAGAWRHE